MNLPLKNGFLCEKYGCPIYSRSDEPPVCELCKRDGFNLFLRALMFLQYCFNIPDDRLLVILDNTLNKRFLKTLPDEVQPIMNVCSLKNKYGEERIGLGIPDWERAKKEFMMIGALHTLVHEWTHVIRGEVKYKHSYDRLSYQETHTQDFHASFMTLLDHVEGMLEDLVVKRLDLNDLKRKKE